jgi:hypothetical protein
VSSCLAAENVSLLRVSLRDDALALPKPCAWSVTGTCVSERFPQYACFTSSLCRGTDMRTQFRWLPPRCRQTDRQVCTCCFRRHVARAYMIWFASMYIDVFWSVMCVCGRVLDACHSWVNCKTCLESCMVLIVILWVCICVSVCWCACVYACKYVNVCVYLHP